MKTFKALSALLTYPDEDLIRMLPEITAVFREDGLLTLEDVAGISGLVDSMMRDDLVTLQERYVSLFDRTRSLSLHLFEHVHGDSRARGQAMVDLEALYRQLGFNLSGNELPDYLPAFLEFLSLLPESEARKLLDEAVHIVVAVGKRLAERGEPYAGVFRAISRLAAHAPEEAAVAQIVTGEGDESPEALDKDWEEAPVTFGPSADPSGGCARVTSILDKIDPRRASGAAARAPAK